MQKYKVSNMNCGHCEARIKKALDAKNIENTIDLENKEVSVTSDVNTNEVIEIIKEAGYTAEVI